MFMNIIFDMETADPDDLLTLCFLAHNPKANLVAVTVTPGTPEQIGMLREVLNQLGLSIPLGAKNPDHRIDEPSSQYKYVSKYYYKVLGQKEIFLGREDALGWEVISDTVRKFPDLTLLTGAPLPNLRMTLQNSPELIIQRWVAQGGFAGDSLVEPEHRLSKFAGKETCPTFNFNGDPKGAELALNSPNIKSRILVSKNVCHGIAYTRETHNEYTMVKDKNLGTQMLFRAMDIYLEKHEEKKLHDPLAACVALNESICTFKPVDMYRRKGEWGAVLNENSNTKISVSVNTNAFFKEFMQE